MLALAATVGVVYVAIAKADGLPVGVASRVRALPWLILAVALGAGLVVWPLIFVYPPFPSAAPDRLVGVFEPAGLIAFVGGLVSGLTAWGLPSWGQRISCFALSLLGLFTGVTAFGMMFAAE